ncbi:hypothetical protein NHF48_019870 [Sphingomonas sp. H160509]|uniref:hypothetical protein n=1 Tax=Sphingomonas sp. H160509 TaxID=2955313 RepID=UPI0020971606|nr:hypothetical protein [Sphingomonas sp. H160509]MDD1452677.1 hypothetical protein [Sphingomonas sp. H160509]
MKLDEDSEYLALSRAYLIENGISPELAIRREAISALDSDAPVPISIEALIGNAREYGLKTEEQAYAVLDQLVIDYPGLILRDGNRYRSLVTIAPRDENGETPPHIGVVGTDWDAMAAEECEALKPLHHGMDANDTAIMRALKQWANQSDDFLSVHYLWLNARAHGYTNGEPTLRYRMKLAPKPLAQTHAHLIEERAKPLGWRLRAPSPDGGDKVKADDEATVAPEPAPEAPAIVMPKVPKSFPMDGDARSLGIHRNAWVFRHRKDQFGPIELPRCQVCNRVLKANNGIVQDHGHKRGEGFNDGPCYGSYHMPVQVDYSAIERLVKHIIPSDIERFRKQIEASPEEVFHYSQKDGNKRITPENWNTQSFKTYHEGFEGFRLMKVAGYERSITALENELVKSKERLAKWKPQPFKMDSVRAR